MSEENRLIMALRFSCLALLLVSAAGAAELKQETVDAWDRYVQSADAAMQARLNAPQTFLWVDERPDRVERVRAGEVLAELIVPRSAHRIPSGLIHHWMGAAFLPNTHVNDVLAVMRDYARYKDYYRPAVIASAALHRSDREDEFSVVMMNSSLLKSAVEIDSDSAFVELDSRRWYSIARSSRVQSIENYGTPEARKLPVGTGPGYIWRVHTISRLAERDGGVYVEVEALALSRDIPGSLRWIIDPIVRRVAKSSVITSLRETGVAANETLNATLNASAHRPVQLPVQVPSGAQAFVKR